MEKLNNSIEPMDIDSSVHSNQEMDVSFNDNKDETFIVRKIIIKEEPLDEMNAASPASSTPRLSTNSAPLANSTPQRSNIKKFHINLQKDNHNQTAIKFKIIVSILALVLSVITYHYVSIQCSPDFNIDLLRNTLSNKLYGQHEAVNQLTEGFKAKEKIKILLIHGGIGVGKTYTASFILQELGHYSNVYHYTMPNFKDTSTEFMVGLTMCPHSFIIIDDLSLAYNIYNQIKDIVTKGEDLDKNITMILIYNCRYNNYSRECNPKTILDQYKGIKAYKKVIKFETLREEHLKRCMEHELHREINDNEFRKLVRSFNVTHDGCKGVHNKMKVLDIS